MASTLTATRIGKSVTSNYDYGISDKEYQRFTLPRTRPASSAGEKAKHAAEKVSACPAAVDKGLPGFQDRTGAPTTEAPVIQQVDVLLRKAIQAGASDIHLEPCATGLQVRYRIDGAMHKEAMLREEMKNPVVSRIKIMANLNITERRLPQDGSIRMEGAGGHAAEFRVSTLPVLHGERVVLRLLDRRAFSADLGNLGLASGDLRAVERAIRRPQGLVLVTGPTGSGKTVTLYSILNKLNNGELNILTVEDPVEAGIAGISQVSVQPEIGFTFAAALRSFLRQDPDVIMVGEIRDRETAEIAIKAAMTGHLVLSTLHTNDAPAAITRLADLGIPRYMIASSLTMVIAQRLGRRLCPHCKRPATIELDRLLAAGLDRRQAATLRPSEPKGCSQCGGIGYKGRTGFFEVLEITPDAAKLIAASSVEDDLRDLALRQGLRPLRLAALDKVGCGETSLEEVLRRTPDCDWAMLEMPMPERPAAKEAGAIPRIVAAASHRIRRESQESASSIRAGIQPLFDVFTAGQLSQAHGAIA